MYTSFWGEREMISFVRSQWQHMPESVHHMTYICSSWSRKKHVLVIVQRAYCQNLVSSTGNLAVRLWPYRQIGKAVNTLVRCCVHYFYWTWGTTCYLHVKCHYSDKQCAFTCIERENSKCQNKANISRHYKVWHVFETRYGKSCLKSVLRERNIT